MIDMIERNAERAPSASPRNETSQQMSGGAWLTADARRDGWSDTVRPLLCRSLSVAVKAEWPKVMRSLGAREGGRLPPDRGGKRFLNIRPRILLYLVHLNLGNRHPQPISNL